MNIIFLDIDGVVCTLRSHFAFDDSLLMSNWDITCCQMIRRLCEKHNCKIVVSSTWKNNDKCHLYLAIFGLIAYEHDDWKTKNLDGIRGDEIKEWLDRHHEINNYIILDDDTDFLDEQKPFLIITETDEGFSSKNYITAEELLKTNNKERENV